MEKKSIQFWSLKSWLVFKFCHFVFCFLWRVFFFFSFFLVKMKSGKYWSTKPRPIPSIHSEVNRMKDKSNNYWLSKEWWEQVITIWSLTYLNNKKDMVELNKMAVHRLPSFYLPNYSIKKVFTSLLTDSANFVGSSVGVQKNLLEFL